MTMKTQEGDKLLQALKVRFEKNMQRHEGTKWAEVQARLEANPAALEVDLDTCRQMNRATRVGVLAR